jgi:hypothetical protein
MKLVIFVVYMYAWGALCFYVGYITHKILALIKKSEQQLI